MSDQNVAALLAALTGGQRPGAAPGAQQIPGGFAGIPTGLSSSTPQPAASLNSPPTGFALPQPSHSGSMDLSQLKPSASGKVSLDDALARAKAKAAELGAHPGYRDAPPSRYDDPRPRYRGRSRSRSRTPPRRGPDPYRDAYSSFRDERRGRAGSDYSSRDRERSYSPPRRGGGGPPYSPPPRERFGGGGHRQRSPPPDMEQINIDASLVGLIIGRGGENLRRVEAETGARVQFMTNGHDRDSGGERVCNIQGTRQQIISARRAIDQIIAENEKATGGGSGGGGGGAVAPPPPRRPPPGSGQPSLREGEDSMQIFVPDRTVGLIIGRGGETIRDIQDKSGCHVNIVGETKSQNGQRPVNLIGSPQAADHAKRLILEIVESDTAGGPPGPPSRMGGSDRGGSGGGAGGFDGFSGPPPRTTSGAGDGKITETMKVPIEAVGMIIGKGGETIKEMQNSTGCRINVSSQFNQNDPEREITLAGSREAVSRARQAIDDKVESKTQRGGGGRGGGGHGGSGGYGGGAQDQSQWPGFGQAQQNASTAPGLAAGQDDPYAPYGGYQNYCAMYYAAMLQQQQQGGAAGAPPGAASGPPGT